MTDMEGWTTIVYLQAGAYIGIMLAVLGVPQMLSSYIDLRARRQLEERRWEERRQDEERRQEERRQDEERRRESEERRRADEERRHQERLQAEERYHQQRLQAEERRRLDAEAADRRHQELVAAIFARNGNGHGNGQDGLIRTLQQTIEDLRAENERLRQQNGNGHSS